MKVVKSIPLLLLLTSVSAAQNYSIDWYVIATGGGHAESENYQSDGTIGQPIVGQSSSENYTVAGGYWVGLPSGGDCDYAPGDCDNDGNVLALEDIMYMIAMYAGDVPPSYVCDCPPNSDTFAATADPNGNCVPLELDDIMWEIAAYSGDVPAYGCEDCPGSGRLLARGGDQPLVMPSLKAKAVRKGSQ
jgi:hypothetical protein